MVIQDIIDQLHSDPAGISSKFNIPLKTVYNWCSGSRKPPAYVITMMSRIIELEGRLIDGKTKDRLGEAVLRAGEDK